MNAEIAVYQGDEVLCMGTVKECARILKIRPETVYYYLMPAHRRRVAKYKNPANARMAVRT